MRMAEVTHPNSWTECNLIVETPPYVDVKFTLATGSFHRLR